MRYVIALILALMLAGCASSPPVMQAYAIRPPQDLLDQCPEIAGVEGPRTNGELAKLYREALSGWQDCRAVVEAIEGWSREAGAE